MTRAAAAATEEEEGNGDWLQRCNFYHKRANSFCSFLKCTFCFFTATAGRAKGKTRNEE